MFDPILQKEYYRVRAVFEPHQVRIDRLPGQPDTTRDGVARVYDADLDVPTYLFVRGDDRNPDKSAALPPGVPECLGGKFPEVRPVPLSLTAAAPDKRPFVVAETLAADEAARAKAKQALEAARQKAGQEGLALAEQDAAIAEARHAALLAVLEVEKLEDAGKKDTDEWKQAATAAATAQRQQALLEARRNLAAARQAEQAAPEKTKPEAAKKTAEAEKALTQAEANAAQPPGPAYTKRVAATYPATSTGRRLAFATWLTSRDNPLAARVAMNHVWMRHVGQPIVPTVFDFGRNGQAPSHPALLDWLAAEFMDSGWSMKHVHRLIVTSSTYRMASTPDDADLAADRDDRYLWRMPSRRLEAEAVRDGVFFVAGRLDATMGGPDIDFQLGLTVPRRSLYFRHAQEKQMEFLKIFDEAAVTECYRRKESIVPQQALALANSELTIRHARLLARELAAKTGTDAAAFITAAFERVLSRPPTAEELAECAAFLKEQAGRFPAGTGPADADGRAPAPDPGVRARENLVQVLLNHNDFVTVR
jgi:hypothetical protein